MPKEIDLKPENLSKDFFKNKGFFKKLKNFFSFRKKQGKISNTQQPIPPPPPKTQPPPKTPPPTPPTPPPKTPPPPTPSQPSQKPKPKSLKSQTISKPSDKQKILKPSKKIKKFISKHKKQEEFVPEINLLGKDLIIYLKSKKIVSYFIISVIFSITLIFSLKALLYFKGSKDRETLAQINREIENINMQVIQYSIKNKEVDEFLERIDIIKKLLSESITWRRFFEFLEKYTLSSVSYDGVSITAGNEFELNGKATSLEDVYQQLEIYKEKDEVESISLQNIDLEKGEVFEKNKQGEEIWKESLIPTFTFKIKLKDEIFYKYKDLREKFTESNEYNFMQENMMENEMMNENQIP